MTAGATDGMGTTTKPVDTFDSLERELKAKGLDALGRNRVIGLRNGSQDEGVNPKDKIGAAKLDLTLLSVPAKIAWAKAAMEGGHKYGAYNWRVEPILFRTYIGAIQRHVDQLLEGEWIDSESLIEHCGLIMANAAIILDAAHQRKLIDDRPIQNTHEDGTPVKSGADLLREANDWIKANKPPGWGR